MSREVRALLRLARPAVAFLLACAFAACADPAGPDAGPGHALPPPPTVRVDSFAVAPGERIGILPSAGVPSSSVAELRVLAAPMAGSVTSGATGELHYQAAAEGHGEDMFTYEVKGQDGRTAVFVAAVAIGTAPSGVPGASVIQQAMLPRTQLEERLTYQGADVTDPRIVALRPLVAEILAAYPPARSALDSARYLRDWLARTAIHPYPPLHPDGSHSNLSVLPIGTSWSDVNALYQQRLQGDSEYWTALFQDGPQMLDSLLGPLAGRGDASGGMMERIGPARYRIRSLDSYRFVLCTYQSQMLIALWAAAGLHGMTVPTLGHDGTAVFIPELRNWIYMDPTYNEEYSVPGRSAPLSPLELVTVSTSGHAADLRPSGTRGPYWDSSEYASAAAHPAASYVGEHPQGFAFMGSQLNNAVTSPFGVPVRNVQLANAAVAADPFFGDPANFQRVVPSIAFPDLGVGIARLDSSDGGVLVRLVSNLPGHVRFQRRLAGGEWHDCPDEDLVPRGAGAVEYRSVDAIGSTGIVAIVRT